MKQQGGALVDIDAFNTERPVRACPSNEAFTQRLDSLD
jgi:hypothetical protein